MFSGFMVNTWIAATLVSLLAGTVGFFVVLRGASFAAHAIPNGAFAGGAGAALVGVSALVGLGAFAVGAALLIALLSRRGRSDAVTALTLVSMLALGALFLSLSSEYEPAADALLFGEILGVSSGQIVATALITGVCLAGIALVFRPLLYSSMMPDVAQASGVGRHAVELVFLLLLALGAALTVPIVGTLLVFILMVSGPGAARMMSSRPAVALGLSVLLALLIAWAAIALSYTTDYPVGFFVGVLGAIVFGLTRLASRLARRGTRAAQPAAQSA